MTQMDHAPNASPGTSTQYVCTVCGYNMVRIYPSACPFCGAPRSCFLTAEECSSRYRVNAIPVAPGINRLLSSPKLGLEHAAYSVDTGEGVIWIDCPSCFDQRVPSTDAILFTHHHFLGASNLYRQYYAAEVWIHRSDSAQPLARHFPFDRQFADDFVFRGVESFHVDGHTGGFTAYIYRDILFVCDYVFIRDEQMRFNPYGPQDPTIEGARSLSKIMAGRGLQLVCGFNYTLPYVTWKRMFDGLLEG